MQVEDIQVDVGESRTLSFDLQTMASTATVYSDNDVTSAEVLVYEYGDGVYGQVDSGTATTVVDAIRTEVDDYWNGLLWEGTSGSNEGQIRLITDFTAADDTLTLDTANDALPATPAADDEYRILNKPIVQTTDLSGYAQGTVSGNTASFQITQANGCTASPRTIIILLKVTYTAGGATDVKSVAWKVVVGGNP